MTYPVFVSMYHPGLDTTILVAQQAVDDYEELGWQQLDPGETGTPDLYLTQSQGDVRYEPAIPRGAAAAGQVPVLQPDGTLAFLPPGAANADTSGATLTQLETEVNELKALLRAAGLLAP